MKTPNKTLARMTAAERKEAPLARGLVDYFPDALVEVAALSAVGSKQHHPDEVMHWDKTKSTDDDDALLRHFVDRGTRDTDNVRHRAKVAWRALAALQREIEQEQEKEEEAQTVNSASTFPENEEAAEEYYQNDGWDALY